MLAQKKNDGFFQRHSTNIIFLTLTQTFILKKININIFPLSVNGTSSICPVAHVINPQHKACWFSLHITTKSMDFSLRPLPAAWPQPHFLQTTVTASCVGSYTLASLWSIHCTAAGVGWRPKQLSKMAWSTSFPCWKAHPHKTATRPRGSPTPLAASSLAGRLQPRRPPPRELPSLSQVLATLFPLLGGPSLS